MSDYIIKIENLGKKYRIRHQQEQQRYVALRDVIASRVKGFGSSVLETSRHLFSRNGNSNSHHLKPNTHNRTPKSEEFWALRNISFEVKQGEVVGIIGRNGAGKSTLLKILSRITEPSEGRVRIRGRVASLLEVGTGFHPELTGRENIYLNGAVLGMNREEIRQKFDEIVAFASVEKFLDTPIKRYSSGMHVRLAFAVAAHLDPEILLVDEVLAVGDAEFQKKCMGKLGEATRVGRTVLLVSHQMAAVENLCSEALLFNAGELVANGTAQSVIKKYSENSTSSLGTRFDDRTERQGTSEIRFTAVTFLNGRNESVDCFRCGEKGIIRLHFRNQTNKPLKNLQIDLGVYNEIGQRILWLSTHLGCGGIEVVPPCVSWVELVMDAILLTPGRYPFTIHATLNGVVADWIKTAVALEVEAGDFYGSGKLPPQNEGNLLMPHYFRLPEWHGSH